MFFLMSYAFDVENRADNGCLFCHQGIEAISDTPVMSTLTCEQCHKGNSQDMTKDGAHQGMYANPSDYDRFREEFLWIFDCLKKVHNIPFKIVLD